MDIKTFKIPITFFLLTLLFVFGAHTVWGHSFVIDESPQANSIQETSPSEITITFNSKVEKNFSIKIIDENQQEVTILSSNISDDQKIISAQIPMLEGGQYQVQYYIVSSNDGHPIEGSYKFQVKRSTPSIQDEKDQTSSKVSHEETAESTEEIEIDQQEQSFFAGNQINLSELIIYLMKIIYYLGLVLLVGWVIWWRIIQNYSVEIKKKYLFWGMILQMVHLIGLISVILIQLNIFSSHGLSFTSDFPLDTNFGFLWFVSLLISLIGFLSLFKNQWVDIFWVIIIVFSKSLNGHPLEFNPVVILVITDTIHLIAASIWAAGLSFIVIFWRKQRLYVKSFVPIFSEYAFGSIVVLTITGSYITFKYVPSWELFFTGWGLFLLLKLFIVSLVVLTGAIIRTKMKKSKMLDAGNWLKIDFILMVSILIIVSILTYLSPIP